MTFGETGSYRLTNTTIIQIEFRVNFQIKRLHSSPTCPRKGLRQRETRTTKKIKEQRCVWLVVIRMLLWCEIVPCTLQVIEVFSELGELRVICYASRSLTCSETGRCSANGVISTSLFIVTLATNVPRVAAYSATLEQMCAEVFAFCTITSMLLGTTIVLPCSAKGLTVPETWC